MQSQFIRVTTGNVGLYPQRGSGLNKAASWSAPARLDSGQGNSVSLAASAGARSRLLRRNQVDNSENRNVPISDFVDNAHLASAASRGAATAAGKSHGMPDWCLARNFC
jgi:hypothetical protein